jgi:hypothetical protein
VGGNVDASTDDIETGLHVFEQRGSKRTASLSYGNRSSEEVERDKDEKVEGEG